MDIWARMMGDKISLQLVTDNPANAELGRVRSLHYHILLNSHSLPIGTISLRLATTTDIALYGGHVGYRINPPWRGNRYASTACILLIPVIRHFNVTPVWITCNPDNTASRRTCEIIGAQYVETIPLPPDHSLRERGDTHKCRYCWEV